MTMDYVACVHWHWDDPFNRPTTGVGFEWITTVAQGAATVADPTASVHAYSYSPTTYSVDAAVPNNGASDGDGGFTNWHNEPQTGASIDDWVMDEADSYIWQYVRVNNSSGRGLDETGRIDVKTYTFTIGADGVNDSIDAGFPVDMYLIGAPFAQDPACDTSRFDRYVNLHAEGSSSGTVFYSGAVVFAITDMVVGLGPF